MSAPSSDRDELTGLPSLHAGRAILEGSVNHNGQVGLLLCDVDHFRHFNAEFGFDRGDQQLWRTARDLQRLCAPSPVFRLNGNAFGIVLHEASLERSREVADKILASQMPVVISRPGEEPIGAMSFFIGIAMFPFHAFTAENLLRAADIALLKVKRGGRLPDGTRYTGRSRVMAWGDFLDEFPHESTRFLNPDFVSPQG